MITTIQDAALGAALHEVTGPVRSNEIVEVLLRFDPQAGPRHMVWDLRAADVSELIAGNMGPS